MAERKTNIQAEDRLFINRKCELMDMSRSTLYYKPIEQEPDLEELEIKKEMDKLHIKHPYMESRSLRDQLQLKGYQINRKRVRRLMNEMNIHIASTRRLIQALIFFFFFLFFFSRFPVISFCVHRPFNIFQNKRVILEYQKKKS